MLNNTTAPPTAEVFHQTTGTWSSTSNTIAYGTIPTNGICGANMTLLGSGKALIAGGSVRVNGEPERRRGRKLRAGDAVSVGERVVHLRVG